MKATFNEGYVTQFAKPLKLISDILGVHRDQTMLNFNTDNKIRSSFNCLTDIIWLEIDGEEVFSQIENLPEDGVKIPLDSLSKLASFFSLFEDDGSTFLEYDEDKRVISLFDQSVSLKYQAAVPEAVDEGPKEFRGSEDDFFVKGVLSKHCLKKIGKAMNVLPQNTCCFRIEADKVVGFEIVDGIDPETRYNDTYYYRKLDFEEYDKFDKNAVNKEVFFSKDAIDSLIKKAKSEVHISLWSRISRFIFKINDVAEVTAFITTRTES